MTEWFSFDGWEIAKAVCAVAIVYFLGRLFGFSKGLGDGRGVDDGDCDNRS